MKFISWNVNGLRALYRKGNFSWLLEHDADFICLQEVKAEPEQLPEDLKNLSGYHSYFDFSKTRKGYSGVAVYARQKPEKVAYNMGIPELDQEGRLIALFYKEFVVLNVYFPNGGGGPERLNYKLRFYDAFLEYIENLHIAEHKKIIFCGDVNTAHEAIDLARPKENEKNTGFLPEERAWLDEVVAHGYVDVFRHLYPTKKDVYTYWDMKTAARERNVGWRIDYFFISNDILPHLSSTKVHSAILGSDHCPIEMTLSL